VSSWCLMFSFFVILVQDASPRNECCLRCHPPLLYHTASLLFFTTQLLFCSLPRSFCTLLYDTASLLFLTTELLFSPDRACLFSLTAECYLILCQCEMLLHLPPPHTYRTTKVLTFLFFLSFFPLLQNFGYVLALLPFCLWGQVLRSLVWPLFAATGGKV